MFLCDEMQLYDIPMNSMNTGVQITMPDSTNATSMISCKSCNTSLTFKQRGYTPEEDIEYRNVKIDNLLSKK